jgi:hypothetical protein
MNSRNDNFDIMSLYSFCQPGHSILQQTRYSQTHFILRSTQQTKFETHTSWKGSTLHWIWLSGLHPVTSLVRKTSLNKLHWQHPPFRSLEERRGCPAVMTTLQREISAVARPYFSLLPYCRNLHCTCVGVEECGSQWTYSYVTERRCFVSFLQKLCHRYICIRPWYNFEFP